MTTERHHVYTKFEPIEQLYRGGFRNENVSFNSEEELLRFTKTHRRSFVEVSYYYGAVWLYRNGRKSRPTRFKLKSHRAKYYIGVYEVTRHYGGSEEGGWWYDWYDMIYCTARRSKIDSAKMQCEKLHNRFDHLSHGDISSVLGGMKIVVTLDKRPGESQTRRRPHYE